MTASEAAANCGAQYYLPYGEDKLTPQLFYKWIWNRCSDGTTHVSLQYRTFAELWHNSMERNPRQFAAERLIAIPGADMRVKREPTAGRGPDLTEAEIQELMTGKNSKQESCHV